MNYTELFSVTNLLHPQLVVTIIFVHMRLFSLCKNKDDTVKQNEDDCEVINRILPNLDQKR